MVEEYFTAVEIKKLGRLINNLGILASQIILRHQPALHQRAYENLQKLKTEEEEFLKKLDRMARRSQDESALRLIEDFDMQASVDVIQSQNIVRRCLLAVAFLGGCIAEYTNPQLELVSHTTVQNLH